LIRAAYGAWQWTGLRADTAIAGVADTRRAQFSLMMNGKAAMPWDVGQRLAADLGVNVLDLTTLPRHAGTVTRNQMPYRYQLTPQ